MLNISELKDSEFGSHLFILQMRKLRLSNIGEIAPLQHGPEPRV